MTQTICDHCKEIIIGTKHIARPVEIDNSSVSLSADLCGPCVILFKSMIRNFYGISKKETPVSSVAATTISENV